MAQESSAACVPKKLNQLKSKKCWLVNTILQKNNDMKTLQIIASLQQQPYVWGNKAIKSVYDIMCMTLLLERKRDRETERQRQRQ